MSYGIIYNKQFIKVDDKNFVPMILSGSNNCYDWNNKRARDWNPFTFIIEGKLSGSLEEMLENAEKDNQSQYGKYDNDYDESMFGSNIALKFNNSYGTFNQYKSFLKTGCRKAKTVEELTELGIGIAVCNSYISMDDKTEEKSIIVKTTQELKDAIKEIDDFYAGTNIHATVQFTNHYDDVSAKIKNKIDYNERLRRKEARREKFAEATEVYIITIEGNAFVKLTKWGYRYASTNYAKNFLSEKEALPTLKRIKDKGYKEVELIKISK